MNKNLREQLDSFIRKNEANVNINNSLEYSKTIVKMACGDKTVSKYLSLLNKKSIETYYHSINVAIISTVMGLGLRLEPGRLIDLTEAALLHDIGKMQISNSILNKPGKLTEEEYKTIQMHSLYGYSLLKEEKDISSDVRNGILFHHENFNGTGYPLCYSKADIPQISRIIHIADIYDAMKAKRPYKDAYATNECFEYMMSLSGTVVDPEILKIFLLFYPAYEIGMNVELSNGYDAVVLKNYSNENLRPKVKVTDGKIIHLNRNPYLNITITKEKSNIS